MGNIPLTIITTVALLLAISLGAALGHMRTLRDEAQVQRQALEALAEDEPIPTPRERRKKLPEGWKIIDGGGALLLLATLGAWIRAHRDAIASTLATAGAASIATVAILGHTTPTTSHPLLGRHPSPLRASHTAYTTTPSTKPGHTPTRTPPATPVAMPPALRLSVSETSPAPVRSAPPSPTAQLSLSASALPVTPAPTATATATCCASATLHLSAVGIAICIQPNEDP